MWELAAHPRQGAWFPPYNAFGVIASHLSVILRAPFLNEVLGKLNMWELATHT